MLMRRFGAASDSLSSAEIVTADGQVLTVSRSSNTDLFWALRGGGANWGILTSFTIDLVSVNTSYTSFSINIADSAAQLQIMKQFQSWIPSAPADFSFLGIVWSSNSLEFRGWYLGPDGIAGATALISANIPNSVPFLADSIKTQSFTANSLTGIAQDSSFKARSSVVVQPLSDDTIRLIQAQLLVAPDSSYILIDGYGGVINDYGIADSAFPWRSNVLFTIQYQTTFSDPADVAAHTAWIDSFYAQMTDKVGKLAYVNYQDSSLGDWSLASNDSWNQNYFGSSYNKLAAVKQKYDPNNLFRTPQSFMGKGNSNPGVLGVNGTGIIYVNQIQPSKNLML